MEKHKFRGQKNSIAQNSKIVKLLKSEVLSSVSHLFRVMLGNSQEKVVDALAALMISIYLLAKRLGISPVKIERKMQENLQDNIDENHEIEECYGDLSYLLNYLRKRD
ncbi:MazG-like family protein [Fuchsiella alkaliacetigena]|uniref:MazG-like family protein n=1 Tax=Fuchsiella alkaliacetigena TaxID=957042 RepID=UPI00200ABA45|nr:MazG-like family protein [Fuchsiella alkaliacetigena]MCK8824551.1 MazG-like family protein [Fuchsiella alkaliacetigena]